MNFLLASKNHNSSDIRPNFFFLSISISFFFPYDYFTNLDSLVVLRSKSYIFHLLFHVCGITHITYRYNMLTASVFVINVRKRFQSKFRSFNFVPTGILLFVFFPDFFFTHIFHFFAKLRFHYPCC